MRNCVLLMTGLSDESPAGTLPSNSSMSCSQPNCQRSSSTRNGKEGVRRASAESELLLIHRSAIDGEEMTGSLDEFHNQQVRLRLDARNTLRGPVLNLPKP